MIFCIYKRKKSFLVHIPKTPCECSNRRPYMPAGQTVYIFIMINSLHLLLSSSSSWLGRPRFTAIESVSSSQVLL